MFQEVGMEVCLLSFLCLPVLPFVPRFCFKVHGSGILLNAFIEAGFDLSCTLKKYEWSFADC